MDTQDGIAAACRARNLRRHRRAAAFALTCASARNYSFTWLTPTAPPPIELELKRLEKRMEELLATRCSQLKEENRALRQRQETLAAEKTSLLHRNEQVRTRVEAMIGRLKAMEHSA